MSCGLDRSETNPASVVHGVGEFPAYAGLLDHLGIERIAEPDAEAFALVESDGRLELRPPGEFDRRGITAAFPPDRQTPSTLARGPLAKAFGSRVHSVLDGTLGLGADAYRLASAGYAVNAWERHPVLFALCLSGWGAAVASGEVPAEIPQRLSFQWGDSAGALDAFEGLDRGIYFDPMYPAQRKTSSLPKRPLQVLRQLLGEASDEETMGVVVADARTRFSRVVVKRPHHAPSLVDGVDFEVSTKLVRFDVYLNPQRMEGATS